MAHIGCLFSLCAWILLVAAVPNDCGGNRFAPACIEPQLVATSADVDDLPNHPEKLLIDVREPSELAATGQIPTSINIPLKTVPTELSLSSEEFEKKYGRKKPATNEPIIFSCRSGVRSGQAAFEADKLGFKNQNTQLTNAFETIYCVFRFVSVDNLQAFKTGNASCSTNTMSIATYEEVLDLPNHPEKLLVDVRNPDELAETGKIPTSINIPLPQLEEGLKLDDEAFKAKFGRDKPSTSTEVIFHCKMGGRAQKATDLASSLGFAK
uniref:Rhodanese domain-containing protein n=1 Tax=Anopheles christyi TaxID=43041 RepID=A0A182JNC3_9DIPT